MRRPGRRSLAEHRLLSAHQLEGGVDARRSLVGGTRVVIVERALGGGGVGAPARGRLRVHDVVVAIRLDRDGRGQPGSASGPGSRCAANRREQEAPRGRDADDEREPHRAPSQSTRRWGRSPAEEGTAGAVGPRWTRARAPASHRGPPLGRHPRQGSPRARKGTGAPPGSGLFGPPDARRGSWRGRLLHGPIALALGLSRLGPGAPLRVVHVVGADDLLHERVADDVHLGELAEADALDAAQDLLRLDEPEPRPVGRSTWVTSPVMTALLL